MQSNNECQDMLSIPAEFVESFDDCGLVELMADNKVADVTGVVVDESIPLFPPNIVSKELTSLFISNPQ